MSALVTLTDTRMMVLVMSRREASACTPSTPELGRYGPVVGRQQAFNEFFFLPQSAVNPSKQSCEQQINKQEHPTIRVQDLKPPHDTINSSFKREEGKTGRGRWGGGLGHPADLYISLAQ